jgi:hypothetical protein
LRGWRKLVDLYAIGLDRNDWLGNALVKHARRPTLGTQRHYQVAAFAQTGQVDPRVLAGPATAAAARVVGDLVTVEGGDVGRAQALAGR